MIAPVAILVVKATLDEVLEAAEASVRAAPVCELHEGYAKRMDVLAGQVRYKLSASERGTKGQIAQKKRYLEKQVVAEPKATGNSSS